MGTRRTCIGALGGAAITALALFHGEAATAAPPWGEPTALSAKGQLAARPIEFTHEANGRGDAVVAWTTDVEGTRVVRAVTRELAGPWSAPATISDPTREGIIASLEAAVDSSGNMILFWSRSVGDVGVGADGVTIDAAVRPASLAAWQSSAPISETFPSGGAPEIVLDRAGNATAVWLAGDSSDAVSIAGASRPASGGAWEPGAPASPRVGLLAAPGLSINTAGTVLASWRDSPDGPPKAWTATKPAAGPWNETTELPLPPPAGPGLSVIGVPNIAIGPDGERIALLLQPPAELSEPSRILESSAPPEGDWSPFELIAGQPRAVSVGAPTPVLAPDGTAYAAWSAVARPPSGAPFRSRLLVSRRTPGGRWAPPTTLSDPEVPSPGGQLSVNARGEAQVLLRVNLSRRRNPATGVWAPAEEVREIDPRRPLTNASDSSLSDDGSASYVWIDQRRQVNAVDRDPTAPRDIRLSRRQLLINQRISQAALRRATAALRRVRAGLSGADLRDGALGATSFATDLDVSGVEQGSFAGEGGRPFTLGSPDRTGDRVTLTAAQLRINQRISQAALRKANALRTGLARGLTGVHFKSGSIGPADIAPGLIVAKTERSVEPGSVDFFRVAPPRPVSPTRLRLNAAQLRTNQRIAQVAVRRSNAIIARLEAGLTGADIRPGGINSSALTLE